MANILWLNDFYVQRLQVAFHYGNPDAENAELGFEPMEFDYDVLSNSQTPNQFALVFRVHMSPPEDQNIAGYELDAEILGFFDTSTLNPASVDYLLRVNGSMMLYGLLRGQVAAFTGSFPAGKLLLPSVDMEDVVEELEAQKMAELEAELEAAQPRPKAKPKAKAKSKAKAKRPAKKRPATRKKGH